MLMGFIALGAAAWVLGWCWLLNRWKRAPYPKEKV